MNALHIGLKQREKADKPKELGCIAREVTQ
jgi:hypothetical protein